jgi:hypothetical protein
MSRPAASRTTGAARGDGGRVVWLALTDGQVREVLRSSTGVVGPEAMLSGLAEFEQLKRIVTPLLRQETTYSGPTLRALLVLAAFPADGSARSVTDVARDVGLAPSSAHRILRALTAVGLVTQNPHSRAYARPRQPPGQDRSGHRWGV